MMNDINKSVSDRVAAAIETFGKELPGQLASLLQSHLESPPSVPINRGRPPSDNFEFGWDGAIAVALHLLNVKFSELAPADQNAAAGRALEQVAVELSSARRRGGSYLPPDRLENRKRYAKRVLLVRPNVPTTIREGILAIVPVPGATEKVEKIKRKLQADNLAAKGNSVGNEIGRLVKEGVLVALREKGGRSVTRTAR